MSFREYIGLIKNNIIGKRFRIRGTVPYEGIFSLHCPYAIEHLVANTKRNPEYPLEIETKEHLQKLMRLPEMQINEKLEVRPDYSDRYISMN